MTMAIQKWLLFLFLHINLHDLILAQLPDLVYASCGDKGNYTENSVYQKNLNSLLSTLSSNMDKHGFYHASIGQNSDMVSAIVLCRGDLEVQECRNCVNNVTQKLVQSCPYKQEAFGGYDGCMLQYSNRSISDATSYSVLYYRCNSGNASKPEEFNQERNKLFDYLLTRAADGGPLRKYASGNATGPDFQTVYALVQCTPDLSPQHCFNCLAGVTYRNMTLCNGKRGGRIIGPSCNFRYESYSFFKDVALEAPPPAGELHLADLI
ncbi:cysteine-rich repeat secretory protein 38-like [Lycium ferocissimum]|uniref:cysteine-rich repeat secretory protein 38-like n=1 Tax=Lycium ferocissimum TaxID=112874 RepID=UPI002816460D|nr:cysteine-rich repeat secretory protein 38-like [Lycium ferocissimum]